MKYLISNINPSVARTQKKSEGSGKRILFIAPQPFFEDRGTPIAVRTSLEAMSDMGYSVDVATFPQGRDVVYPGIHLHRTSNPFRFRYVPIGFSLRKVLLDLCLLATVLRLVRRTRYNCVHGVEEGAGIGLLVKVLFRWPVIYDMQSSLPEQLRSIRWFGCGPGRWICLKFERLLIHHVDAVIASRGLARRVLSIDPAKKVVECFFEGRVVSSIYNDELPECHNIINRPAVVYVGNFAKYQSLNLLLEAAEIIKTQMPDVLFLLVGGTKTEIVHLAKIIRKKGIEKNVQMIARRPYHEVPEYLALADVLVLPRSRGENAPLKLFDYMKSGQPIVATDIPAHRALLSEDTATLVRPQAHDLVNGILKVLRDPKLGQKVAGAALTEALINEDKTLSKTIADVYSLVTEI